MFPCNTHNPRDMRGYTGKHIGGCISTGDSPGNSANYGSTGRQWATRVSHAHSLAHWRCRANGILMHSPSVDNIVSILTSLPRHGQHLNPLQVIGGISRMLKMIINPFLNILNLNRVTNSTHRSLSPTRCPGHNILASGDRAQGNRRNGGTENYAAGSFNRGNIVGQGVGVVIRMVNHLFSEEGGAT